MMYQTMDEAGLYPPMYFTKATTGKDAVTIMLVNEARPSIWNQVSDWLDKHGTIANAQVRKIMRTENPLAASKALQGWVKRGFLVVANPAAAKRNRRYMRPEDETLQPLFSKRPG